MNFYQKLADFVLGNRATGQLPDIALTGMYEQYNSESLLILAGMTDKDNAFELEQYFNKMLQELKINLPSKLIAAYILLDYYLKLMVSEPEDAFRIMTKINNIYRSNNWIESNPELSNNYVGEELGLQNVYTWYRELQDFEDGSKLFYYNELTRPEQKKKFEQHLIQEAENWLSNNEKKYR